MEKTWNKFRKCLSFKLRSKSSTSLSNDFVSDFSMVDLDPSLPMPSSSSGVRLSRSNTTISTSSSSTSTTKPCSICLGSMKPEKGDAIFTAECSHTFHFNCIASSVKNGNKLCPLCRSTWKDLPFQAPIDLKPIVPHSESQHFSDDEPLLVLSNSQNTTLSTHQAVTIKGLPAFSAVHAADSPSTFSVLVGVRAPPLSEDACRHDRAPIDLVTVLDISGSMAGTKLVLLKRAVSFVISNLGPADRLAIISFSSTARRDFPLRLMSDTGRASAILAVNSLTSGGGTNIIEGLRKGVKVLEDRRERNPVSSIILLSDGRDTYNMDNYNYHQSPHDQAYSNSSSWIPNFLDLLPPSLFPPSDSEAIGEVVPRLPPISVHSFGVGSDHDSTVMHAISDASGGTFSFIEAKGSIQDAFARCIGGLLSVVAQELRLSLRTISPGVSVVSILTGKYSFEIFNDGQQGLIDVGDLYADEEKDFLVHMSVPEVLLASMSEEESKESMLSTSLLSVECLYKDPLSKEIIEVDRKVVEIHRPQSLSSMENRVCLEVDRLKNRLLVAEGIAEAQEMAEKGDLEGAQSVLADRRSVLLTSASAQAGDGLCNWLEAELKEIRERMGSRKLYEETGRAYVLSGLSSHSWQRATTSGCLNNSMTDVSVAYETPSMVTMVTRSQTISRPDGFPPKQTRRLTKSSSFATH